MPPLLEVDAVTSGYGKVEILHDLSISVPEGTVVALLGPNGAGKTTTLKVISGTLPVWQGCVNFDGRRLDGQSAYEIARGGVALVPEGRGIFPGLNVRENLEIGARAAGDRDADGSRKERIERVLETFPRLRERLTQRAGTLSGGEQQMLALSRAFLCEPRLLLMDEISMGLAPRIVEQLFESVADLRAKGMTIVLVEQYLTYALRLADICYVLAKGRIEFVGEPSELRDSEALASSYLGG
ncbi:MAG: amino acid/amide transporter ATP-binding protein 2, family [Acidimicrobiales bacterium]|nr:amino acid/amide transporter ATP-binding protein 2, family [Acidimicrobiales bacterium]